jgi:deoxyadenosine/deoxycytidine kinase
MDEKNSAPPPGCFIALDGIIAAGKSTLTTYLAERLGFQDMPEPFTSCPLMEDFYKDPKRWACSVQLWMLLQRYRDHQAGKWGRKSVVQDRSIYADTVFSHNCHELGLLTDAELELYLLAFETMSCNLAYPDVVVFLDISTEMALHRIKERGRPMEQGITAEYLDGLRKWHQALQEELANYTVVLHYNWDTPQPDRIVHDLKRVLNTGRSLRWAKMRPWNGRLKITHQIE